MLRTAVALVAGLIISGCLQPHTSELDARESRRRTDVFPGSALLSSYAHIQRDGDTLVYDGAPQAGCLSYGPYAQVSGLDVMLIPSIEFAAQFRPETYDTCNKRDWKNKCVGWATHDREYGLTVDVIGQAGGQRFSAQKEFKNPTQRNIPRQNLAFDPLRFGPAQSVSDVEVRICGITSQALTAQVYKVSLEWVWDEEVCDDPVRCPRPEVVREFIRSLNESLPVQARNLISHRSYYYLAKKAEHATACLIKETQKRPGVADLANELKQRFAMTFGKSYQADAYDCSTGTSLDIHAESCSPEDASDVCEAVRSFQATHAWFKAQQEEIARRLTADTVRQSPELYDELEFLFREVDYVIKN